MLTITFCKREEWRLLPAVASNGAGWQFHWLGLYVEWRHE
jgi:hypothetical protein